MDDVDVVALLKLKSNTYGSGERKKLKTDGTRILHMSPSPASVTKNRYGITEDIEIVRGETLSLLFHHLTIRSNLHEIPRQL